MRARFRSDGFNPHRLELYEALLGDHENYGMTEREYRTGKKVLEVGGFATFKTTNKGTIGKLIDSRLFRVNAMLGDGQDDEPNDRQTTSQTTTNLELRRIESKNTDKAYSTKASKLSRRQKEIADQIEAALGVEWQNDAGKWIERVKSNPSKCERVIAEVGSAARERRIKTTPARYAEDTWKRFR